MARSTSDNSWEGITRLAREAGAKFPELVAAQWALESGWGKSPSGKNNFWGLKGAAGSDAALLATKEEVGGKLVQQKDLFLNFPSIKAGVEYLVSRWYKDWEGHKGVNRNETRDAAAVDLLQQGYATDSKYALKLMKLMDEHALPPSGEQPGAGVSQKASPASKPVLRIEALQDSWLKKERKQAAELGEKERHGVARGRVYEVVEWIEVPQDAHSKVILAHGAGTWYIWEPHWRKLTGAGEAMPRQVDWSDFSCLVTPHLTVGEILRWDRRRIPVSGAHRHQIIETAKQFEAIRKAWGRGPLGVTSFYRPPAVNAAVGGVPNSTHIDGRAMDIYPLSGSLDAFYQWLLPRWSGGLGDGRARGFLHLDTRPGNGRFVPGGGVQPWTRWNY